MYELFLRKYLKFKRYFWKSYFVIFDHSYIFFSNTRIDSFIIMT